jgi:PKD repeat protein
VTYTPAANYFGADAFSYTASDGYGGTATATVSVTVSERPNAAPVASLSATPSSGDAPLTVTLSGAGSSDPDAGDSISSYTFTFGDGSAPVTQSGPAVSHTYSAPGSYTATLVVRDQKNASSAPASKTITVTQPNRAPVANNDSAQTAKNTAVTLNVLTNDSDPDGDALSVAAVGLALNGTVANNGGGSVTYTPSNGYSGTDSFSYTISDGHGHTASANVTITVSQSASGPKAGGSGTVNGASFSFNMKRISYSASGISIDGTVDSMQISGNVADFSGLCSMSSGPCTYSAHAEDNAGGDRFSIRIYNGSGVQIHQNDGTVGGGDIKIR